MKTQLRFRKFYLQAVLLVAGVIYLNDASSQSYENLKHLTGTELQVYYSAGHEPRAKDVATRTQNAINFTTELVGFRPEVVLLVLDPEDWKKHTSFPVYGMPHYTDKKTLIIASSDNNFWKSFIPPVEQLPASLAEKIKNTYKSGDGNISMQPFFDLLAIHELGHAFHIQAGLTMQRKWMGELFCNILLHTFIEEREPHQLDALTVFPEMVVVSGATGYKFTTLSEFENNYNVIGQKHPKNYGWYQGRLHVAAKNIFGAGGKKVIVKLWKALRSTSDQINDNQLATLLKKKVHKSVADVFVKW